MLESSEMDIDAIIRDLLEGNHSEDDSEEDHKDSVKKRPCNEVAKHEQSSTDCLECEDGLTLADQENGDVADSDHVTKRPKSYRSGRRGQISTGLSSVSSSKIDPLYNLDRVQALRDSLLDYLVAEESDPTAMV
ncbi:unnamed protein product [Protopolystoma xenopodis]|uniref:Uncharacterized protein n=1 Tax=Protopolystoma xenopodis TaxID=117903 RepID=A0A3S5FFC6_9PLAT|nr:unnamed protein product [Protopolystoma xenopodis]